MRNVILILLVLFVFSLGDTVHFQLKKTGRYFELKRNGNVQYHEQYAKAGKQDVHFGGFKYIWYDPPDNSSFTALNLPDSYKSSHYKKYSKIAKDLYTATLLHSSPQTIFVESVEGAPAEDSRVICSQAVIPTTFDSFSCPPVFTDSVSVEYHKVDESYPSDPSNHTRTISINFYLTNATDDQEHDATLLALYRLYYLDVYHDQLSGAIGANHHRESSSTVAIGIGWFCMGLLVFSWMTIFTLWQSWLFPLCSDLTLSPPVVLIVWILVWSLVTFVVGMIGRVWGFVAMLLFFMFFSLLFFITYRCKKIAGPEYSLLASSEVDIPSYQGESSFTRIPSQLGGKQHLFLWFFFIVTLIDVVALLIICFAWSQPDYYVFDREIVKPVVEYKPLLARSSQAILYTFPGVSKWLKLGIIWNWVNSFCGSYFYKPLTTTGEKKQEIYENFIREYDVDMSIYEKTSYTSYSTVNDWFIRKLASSQVRPLCDHTNCIASPAEGRAMVLKEVPRDLHFWIKGEDFHIESLLDNENIHQTDPSFDIHKFSGGPMVIVRLAPQDYHRIHVPASGIITSQHSVSGSYESVSSDAMKNDNDAYYNYRIVNIVKMPEDAGFYAIVAIGASCVGSIVMKSSEGGAIYKSEELGYFQFGGSTIVVLFEKGKVSWDHDLISRSIESFETLVHVKSQIGVIQ